MTWTLAGDGKPFGDAVGGVEYAASVFALHADNGGRLPTSPST